MLQCLQIDYCLQQLSHGPFLYLVDTGTCNCHMYHFCRSSSVARKGFTASLKAFHCAGKLVTIFSAPDYPQFQDADERFDNKASVLILKPPHHDEYDISMFTAADRPAGQLFYSLDQLGSDEEVPDEVTFSQAGSIASGATADTGHDAVGDCATGPAGLGNDGEVQCLPAEADAAVLCTHEHRQESNGATAGLPHAHDEGKVGSDGQDGAAVPELADGASPAEPVDAAALRSAGAPQTAPSDLLAGRGGSETGDGAVTTSVLHQAVAETDAAMCRPHAGHIRPADHPGSVQALTSGAPAK